MQSMNESRTTKKQQALLTFVRDFIDRNQYGPSYREIMNGLGYKSVSTVAVHIDALIAKGFLQRGQDSVRSLEVVDHHRSEGGNPSLIILRMIEKKLPNTTQAEKETLLSALEILGMSQESSRLRKEKHDV